MTTRIALGFLVLMFVAMTAIGGGKAELQKYFSNTANKVKAADDPVEKRMILNESLHSMTTALDMIQGSPAISKNDAVGIEHFRTTIQEKHDELTGANGYVRVPDAQLNAFSDYVVQDMEQAAEMITISVVTLLLIIILIVLLV
ncbi:MAG: hypothetical protein ACKVRP_05970 [Bacteroidota bacterium]